MGKKILNCDKKTNFLNGMELGEEMGWDGKDWKKKYYQETSSLSSHHILVICYT